MPNPTPTEWRILNFAKDHPEMSQKQIAEAVECHPTCVSRAYRLYMPERRKKYEPGVPTELQAKILEMRKAYPDMRQKDIAKELHVDKSVVSQAIGKYLPGTVRKERNYNARKSDSPKEYTLRPCLRCGKPHKSTWAGDRIHPRCKETMVYQYIPDHRVYVEGHGRV